MNSCDISIDKGESVKVHFYHGHRSITAMVWQERSEMTSVSVAIDGVECFVVELTDDKLEVTKNTQPPTA